MCVYEALGSILGTEGKSSTYLKFQVSSFHLIINLRCCLRDYCRDKNLMTKATKKRKFGAHGSRGLKSVTTMGGSVVADRQTDMELEQ